MARTSLAILALIMCAWYLVGVRSARQANYVSAMVRAPISQAREADAEQRLSDARLLNPDENLNLLLAEVQLRAGQLPQAERTAKAIVRREPDNAGVWFQLGLIASYNQDPVTGVVARTHFRQLVPAGGA